MVGQPSQDVGKCQARGSMFVEAARFDQYVHRSGTMPANIRSCERPVASTNGNAPDGRFSRKTDFSVTEKKCELRPSPERIVDRNRCFAFG